MKDTRNNPYYSQIGKTTWVASMADQISNTNDYILLQFLPNSTLLKSPYIDSYMIQWPRPLLGSITYLLPFKTQQSPFSPPFSHFHTKLGIFRVRKRGFREKPLRSMEIEGLELRFFKHLIVSFFPFIFLVFAFMNFSSIMSSMVIMYFSD